MHYLNNRRRGQNYGMALKLDISKAYECVEWEHLRHLYQSLGFDEKWISCVSLVS